ncbi:hypothetical protein BDW02DRAFT_607470 [Decorospora gaudefroyi]|uniref:Zn(2)-C6 fungal-type domain-containing protein n=1 Tax=Decorospora gaudefroyi TaxID=184978 RepID=A0A6A5K4K0_9PLEO|nr:hypothetical protein BDW02DRAFT_607470 [Decorospora gaudefroyi]
MDTPHQNHFYAFRSSCERCRHMKLKCLSNDNSTNSPCERCVKARIPCTYNRRSSFRKRTPTGQDNGPKTTQAEQGLIQNDGSPFPTSGQALEITDEPGNTFCYTDNLNVLPDHLLWATLNFPSSPSNDLWPNEPPPVPERRASVSAQYTLSLANLAVELGECLQMLRVHMGTQAFIDDYPIGHIRHLSQSFVTLAHSKPISTDADTSTILLLLSCHISLRKIYINAFSNINEHLPVLPAAEQPVHHDPRSMRLRGMDMHSEDCMRNYTAFNITLDLLQNCDAALGLCSVCRPTGQASLSSYLTLPLANSQNLPSVEISEATSEGATLSNACIGCALPPNVRKEVMSVFTTIVDQEHALNEVIVLLGGELRRRMGLV